MMANLRKNFLNGSKTFNSIGQAAFLICVMGLASRFLGLIRDRILAAKFGAGNELDVYYAAFKIPDLIFNLLVLGALSAAFVPVFTSLISLEKKKRAWELVNNIFSVALLALGGVALIIFIFAPYLVKLITFGYDPEKQALVVELTRIMLLSPILLGFSGVLGGVLNSFKKFFFYSLAPIFYNTGIIVGALFFTEIWWIHGLAWGVVLGALLHLLIQLPEVIRCGFKFQWSFDLKNKDFRRVIKLMIPRSMGLAVTQINFLVVTVLASTLAAGSLAIFNLANNIQSVPLGMIGISFAVAAFPTLSAYWSRGRQKDFILNFSKTFRQIAFFIIPFSVVFIVLRAQIVRVVLGSGKFDWEDTILTFQALGIFSLSLFAQCLIPLLARAFYAIQNTKVPFFTGLFSEAVNIALALILINYLQDSKIIGLVWAFSISTIINMFLLLFILKRKLGNLNEEKIVSTVWRVLIAALAMAVVMQISKYYISFVVDMDKFVGVFIQLTGSLLAGTGIFLLLGKALKIKELKTITDILKKKKTAPKVSVDEDRDEVSGI